ncbi:MAG: T9SS type A sorting domain-containing protein, partial [Cytophagales bacterium]|nr:T9SS type A sorting domain-containing protein [Cytophaga sp.]
SNATDNFDLFSKNITAQYIRVYCYTRVTNYGFSIYEFQAYGSLHVDKPVSKVIVNPGMTELKIGQSVPFTATGYNADGAIVDAPGAWTVSGGGTINASGVFSASANGTFTVTYTTTTGSIKGTASVKVGDNSAKQFTGFGIVAPATTGTVSGNNISVIVPKGTSLTNLVATFTNSPSSTVKVGSVVQTSGVTANNFTTPVTYTITAQDGTTTTYTVTVVPSGTTGISAADERSLKVYPNPTSGTLTIETETNFDYISLNNIIGQEVLSYKSNAASVSLDVSSLPKGVYLMKVTCGDRILDKKVIVE